MIRCINEHFLTWKGKSWQLPPTTFYRFMLENAYLPRWRIDRQVTGLRGCHVTSLGLPEAALEQACQTILEGSHILIRS